MTPALRITRPAVPLVTPREPARPQAVSGPTAEPAMLLDAADLARELRTSVKTIQRMHANGRLPAPLLIGSRSLRWSRDTLVRWIAAGGPPREQFEQSQN